MLYDRDIDRERATQYGLTLDMPVHRAQTYFDSTHSRLLFSDITVAKLEKLRGAITDARICFLTHPSGRTWARWLEEVGFHSSDPFEGGFGRRSGAWYAGQRFDKLADASRPREIATVDALLRPMIEIVIRMPAPLNMDPMLTAIK